MLTRYILNASNDEFKCHEQTDIQVDYRPKKQFPATTEKQSHFRNGAASLARQLVTHLREASGGLKSPQANREHRQEMLQFRQSVHYEANA